MRYLILTFILLGCLTGYTKEHELKDLNCKVIEFVNLPEKDVKNLGKWMKRALEKLPEYKKVKDGTLKVQNNKPVFVIRICKDSEELGELTNLPITSYLIRNLDGKVSKMQIVAACDIKKGIMYLTRIDKSDFYHELGHWFFKTSSEKEADAFMEYCD